MKILVAEDEERISRLIQMFLEKEGHEVTMVSDGQQAIDSYKQALYARTPFDLVLADINTPVKDGSQVTAEIIPMRPNQKIVLGSAFGFDLLTTDQGTEARINVFTKKFGRVELGDLLRKVFR